MLVQISWIRLRDFHILTNGPITYTSDARFVTIIIYSIKNIGPIAQFSHVQVVHEKMCFFTIHCNHFLAYIAVRDLHFSNAMGVYSHSYWLVSFCTTNSSRVLARERWQTFENS